MTLETFTDLHDHIQHAALGREITSVEMGEMGDGSTRSFALVRYGNDDVAIRYITSAPADSPSWARVRFTVWSAQVEVA